VGLEEAAQVQQLAEVPEVVGNMNGEVANLAMELEMGNHIDAVLW
jgi:hypothetical protein